MLLYPYLALFALHAETLNLLFKDFTSEFFYIVRRSRSNNKSYYVTNHRVTKPEHRPLQLGHMLRQRINEVRCVTFGEFSHSSKMS